jgi:hypothetical protein
MKRRLERHCPLTACLAKQQLKSAPVTNSNQTIDAARNGNVFPSGSMVLGPLNPVSNCRVGMRNVVGQTTRAAKMVVALSTAWTGRLDDGRRHWEEEEEEDDDGQQQH